MLGASQKAILLGLATVFLAGTPSGAQQYAEAPCDALRPVTNAMGYRVREANVRCEGLYESVVRAIDLELVGVMAGAPLDFSQSPVEVVGPDIVDMPSQLIGQTIQVRAVALPLKTYYRMDGVLDDNSRLLWPIDEVIQPAGLGAGDLALYGWVGTELDKTFVPVRAAAGGADNAGTGVVKLMLRVSSHAEKVYWKTAENGVETDWALAVEGPVGSGQTIAVDLPQGSPSLVRVDVTAKPKNSDDWTTIRFNVLRAIP